MRRSLTILALLMMVLAQFAGAVLAYESWPEYRANDQNTGTALNTAPRTNLPVWTATLAGLTDSSPAVGDGKVFIGDSNGTVWAFNAEKGTKVWSFKTNGSIESSPTYLDDRIYIGSNDGNLYALNASTGALVWSFKTGGAVKSSVSSAIIDASPGVKKKVLVFGSYDNKLYGLDTGGKMLWNFTAASFIHGKPGISDGKAFTCTCDRTMYGIDLVTGEKALAIPFNDYSAASPSIVNGIVYGTARGGKVFAVSIQEQAIKWEFNTNQTLESSPAVGDSKVIVGNSAGDVVAVDSTTGQRLWSFKSDASVSSSAALVNGEVFFGDDSGKMYALSAVNGTKIWTFKADGAIGSSPAVANGRVYFGTETGTLYAIGDLRPVVTLISPLRWTHVEGKLDVQFEIVGANIDKAEVWVDGKLLKTATRPDVTKLIWEASIDTNKLKNEEHLIEARATNSSGTGSDSLYIIVENPAKPKPFIPSFDMPMLIGITIFISVVIKLGRLRFSGRKER
jgi:outer membrane protein assembly factor BamB